MGDSGIRPPSLWSNRNFLFFWALQALSVAGDAFSFVAIPLLVLHATGSVAQMGLLTGLAGAASVVTGVFAGVLVDRLDRRRLMVACDALRAVAYGAVPLLWLAEPRVWLLYLVVPLGSALGMVFRVSYVTAVTGLVDPEHITEANGRLSATYAVASVLGPMLAGVVSALVGPAVAVGVDAVTFAISAVGLTFVRLTTRGPRPARARHRESAVPDPTSPRPVPVTAMVTGRRRRPRPLSVAVRDLSVGAVFLWRHPVLRTLTILLTLSLFLMLGLTDLFIYRLKHDLDQSDQHVGNVLAVGASGTVLAALIVARARRRFGVGACWITAQTLAGLAVVAMGFAGHVATMAAFATVYTFGIGIAGICSMSLRQEVTPGHLLGRVTSAFWTIHYAAAPIGAALLTWAADRFGSTGALLVAGTGCSLIALSGLLTPLVRPAPSQAPVPHPAT
ncbi:MFS transporter [Plantactinospora sp. GCM10030261]|uniref:MFS transporter n=1 Tax=Plantactinospora sp. GCM10030261 TaxID=3273420 RepID=UPI003605E58D